MQLLNFEVDDLLVLFVRLTMHGFHVALEVLDVFQLGAFKVGEAPVEVVQLVNFDLEFNPQLYLVFVFLNRLLHHFLGLLLGDERFF